MTTYITLTKHPRILRAPMLACKQGDLTREEFLHHIANTGPYYTQPKKDGVRCLKLRGVACSRKLLAIPNRFISNYIAHSKLWDGVDGEITTLDEQGNPEPFNTVQSKVMSRDGEPNFIYTIFDYAPEGTLDLSFEQRYMHRFWADHDFDISSGASRIKTMHNQMRFYNKKGDIEWLEQIEMFYTQELQHEGVIFRKPSAKYKCGRSTLDQGYLIALTHWQTAEAQVLDFYEMQHNFNAMAKGELGETKRSKSKQNLVGAQTLGGLTVRDTKSLAIFNIGSGFTDEEKLEIWNNQSKYKGRILTYKYKPFGQKDKPRTPIFVGWRFDV